MNNKVSLLASANYILFIISILCLAQPYFTWHNAFLWYLIAFSLLLVQLTKSRFMLSKTNIFFFTSYLILTIWYSLSDGKSIIGCIVSCISVAYLLIDKDLKVRIFHKLSVIYSIVISISIFTYFCVIVMGISPIKYIEPLNAVKQHLYAVYPFLVVPDYSLEMFRFCGPFDEPGVVGTFSTIFLYSDRFNLKNIRNIPILLSGLFSFSLFFYLMLFIYLILNKRLILIYLTITILPLFSVIKNNEYISSYIINRLEYDTEKGFSGNNRTSSGFDFQFDKFLNSDDLLTGVGGVKARIDSEGGCSYKIFIYQNGVILFILVCMFYVYYAKKLIINRRDYFTYLVMFACIMFQRPLIFDPFYFILLVYSANYTSKLNHNI